MTAPFAPGLAVDLQPRMVAAVAHHRAGDTAAAEAGYREVLSLWPLHPEANHHLGLLGVEAGRPDLALPHLRIAAALKPEDALFQRTLARAWLGVGQPERALAAVATARTLGPDRPVLQELAAVAEARRAAGEPVPWRDPPATAPGPGGQTPPPPATSALAAAENRVVAALNAGEATTALAKATELCDRFQEAPGPWRLRAGAAAALGQHDAAVGFFGAAAERGDASAELATNLANSLFALGRLDAAESMARLAVVRAPAMAAAHNNLGTILWHQGRTEDAASAFRAAVTLAPGHVRAWVNLGGTLRDLKALEEAETVLAHAVELAPDDPDIAFNHLALLEGRDRVWLDRLKALRARFPDHPRLQLPEATLLYRQGDLDGARALLEAHAPGEAPDTRAMHGFLLARICDAQRDTAAAFAAYAAGNEARSHHPQARRHDKNRYLARVRTMDQALTPDWLARWGPPAPPDPAGRPSPVFIVGFPRSGTTLLDTVMLGHPQAAVLEEDTPIDDVTRVLLERGVPYPEGLADLTPDTLAELRDIYYDTAPPRFVSAGHQGPQIIDKMPLNMVKVALMYRLFPDSPILFALRHPCDSVLSCFMQNFQFNEGMANFHTLPDAARLYTRVMSLWHKATTLLPLRLMTVRHEALVADFEPVMREVLAFIALPWREGLENFHERAAHRDPHRTPGYNQVRQPLNTRGCGRWERYRAQMTPALPVLRPWVQHFGYTMDEPARD